MSEPSVTGPINRAAVVYPETGGVGVLVGPPHFLADNMSPRVRLLDGTRLADVSSPMDPRLPATLEDFDRLFPSEPAP